MRCCDSVKRQRNCIGIVETIIIFILSGLLVYVLIDEYKSSHSATNELDEVCSTEECIKLSSSILSWMNTSTDPCDDFYQYSCGGFKQKYEYKLLNNDRWTVLLHWMSEQQNNLFSDFLDDDVTDNPLHSHDSISAFKTFYKSCYESTVEIGDIESNELLREFIDIIHFTDSNFSQYTTWNDDVIDGFQKALSWLTAREWNDLFVVKVSVIAYNDIYVHSPFAYWSTFNKDNWYQQMDEIYISLYQQYFGLTVNESEIIADLMVAFMEQIANISSHSYLGDWTTQNFDLFVKNDRFSSNRILNYSNIILSAFNLEDSGDINNIHYHQNDVVNYFGILADFISSTPPYIIQYWLFTNVLSSYFDFGAFQQSRDEDSSQFCYGLTKTQFDYLYLFIFVNMDYSPNKQNMIEELGDDIINNGLSKILNNASWIDDSSKKQIFKKIDHLDTYFGIPSAFRNITLMDEYYKSIKFDETNSFLDNYAMLKDFKLINNINVFKNQHAFIDPLWPMNIDAYINPNAFYNPWQNMLHIPPPISRQPFFFENGPSAINYGGLGMVIGHEIAQRFDSSGSLRDWKGDLNDTWTNNTRNEYNKRVECIANKYNKIEINDGIFANTENSKGEDIADNLALEQSWTAYKSENRYLYNSQWDNIILPGFGKDFNNDKLFWISYAQNLCEVSKDDYYKDRAPVHSAGKVRTIGGKSNWISTNISMSN